MAMEVRGGSIVGDVFSICEVPGFKLQRQRKKRKKEGTKKERKGGKQYMGIDNNSSFSTTVNAARGIIYSIKVIVALHTKKADLFVCLVDFED